MVENGAVRTFPKSVQPGIPKLAGPKPGWRQTTFGDLLYAVSRPVDMDDEEIYDLVTVKRSRGGVVKRDSLRGSKVAVKTQFYLEEGDFLISKRQIVHGACGLVPKELDGSIVSNEYSVLRTKEGVNANFISYLSHSIYFQQTCFHSSIGVHVEKMIFKLEDWFKWRVNIPPLSEQIKIASFLGAVDEKLTALRRKKELLTDYKRGVMQQLFSQKVRFKKDDGSSFPVWEEKRLGEVAERVTTKNLENQHSRVLTNSATQGVIDQGDYFDKDIANADNLDSYYVVDIGDFVYNPRISVSAPVGPIKRNHLGAGVMSPLYSVFRFHDGVIEFFERYFEASIWHKYMCSVANYGARHDRMNITTADFMAIPLPFPHPDEQQKIADLLSAFDAKIDAVAKQADQLEDFKKGLLQQMFV